MEQVHIGFSVEAQLRDSVSKKVEGENKQLGLPLITSLMDGGGGLEEATLTFWLMADFPMEGGNVNSNGISKVLDLAQSNIVRMNEEDFSI